MTSEPQPKQLAPAAAKTWTDFAVLEARYEQTELLDGNSGESTFQLVDHGGYWEFSPADNRITITLRGTSEHQITAEALRWLADRLDEAR